MSDHVLNRHEISLLCDLNFNTPYYRSIFYFKKNYLNNPTTGEWPDVYIQEIKPEWDRVLFSDLLKKQPELSSLVDDFWKKSKTEEYISSLVWKQFEDKILLKNVKHLIFNTVETYSGAKDRKDFIKKMVKYEPSLMNDLHEKVKLGLDTVLLSTYVELLPSYLKEIKEGNESIWKNLKKTKDFSESNYVQVLRSAVKTFTHDKELYEFLKEHCSPKFETFHTLRDKFKKFEDKYFSQFKVEKEVEIFSNNQEYKYIFCIKDSIMIDYFGVSKDATVIVQRQIHNCIKDFLNKNVGTDLSYSYSAKGLEINTSNFEHRPRIELFMEKLKPCIKDILSSLDQNTKDGFDKEAIPKLFKTATLKFELEDTLENKEYVKPKKSKI